MKDALRRATYPWFEAEFSSIHRSTSTSITASSEDALASTLRLQVASCEDDDYVHAKRNDKDVPQNSRRRKTRKASHSCTVLLVCNKVTNDERTVVLSITIANDRALDQSSEDENVLQRSKKVGVGCGTKCDFVTGVPRPKYCINKFRSSYIYIILILLIDPFPLSLTR